MGAGLTVFNKVILRTAFRRRLPVIDLRQIYSHMLIRMSQLFRIVGAPQRLVA